MNNELLGYCMAAIAIGFLYGLGYIITSYTIGIIFIIGLISKLTIGRL